MISTKELEDKWSEDALLSVKNSGGSSNIQVIVFTSDSKQIKAAPRLQICDNCLVNYCTCFTALAADLSSIDTMWFVKVVKVCLSQEDEKMIMGTP